MSILGQHAGDYPCVCGCGGWNGQCYGGVTARPWPRFEPYEPLPTLSVARQPSGFTEWRIKPRKRGRHVRS